MTKGSSQSSIEDLSNYIIELSATCKKEPTPANFRELLEICTRLAKMIRIFIVTNKKSLDPDFDIDVAMEFIGMALAGRDIGSPLFKIKAIISYRINRQNRIHLANRPDKDIVGSYDPVKKVSDDLVMKETINDEVRGLPDDVTIQVLYYLKYPEHLTAYVNDTPNSVTKHVVSLKVFMIQKKIMNDNTQTVDITLSKNRITNLLLLSGLYNEYPAMFVLLSMLQDFKTFIQFVTLFQNETIKVPKVEDLNELFGQSSAIAANFENGKLTIRSREMLANLITNCRLEDIGPDTKMNAYLEQFIAELVSKSVESYAKLQDKLINQLDRNDPKKVLETYQILNTELSSQQQLISEMVTTMTTISDIKTAMEKISRTSDVLAPVGRPNLND